MSHFFRETSYAAFVSALAPSVPCPGRGGSVVLSGVIGMLQCSMAGNLAAGRKKDSTLETGLQKFLVHTDSLQKQLFKKAEVLSTTGSSLALDGYLIKKAGGKTP